MLPSQEISMVQSASSHETTYGKSTGQHLKDKARSDARKVESELQEAAHSVADQGREMSENVQAVANNMKDAFEKSMREKPLTTLAMAAAFAFVLGAIWKS
jgi:ElaB/YqjD/DUF883 family membrane-anchored ribosome-binding protein